VWNPNPNTFLPSITRNKKAEVFQLRSSHTVLDVRCETGWLDLACGCLCSLHAVREMNKLKTLWG
jgi:hypothetical protein